MTHINIKERRLDLGLHLEDVAKRVGVSAATVSRWESGEIGNMGRDKIQALADVLRISPLLLLDIDIPEGDDYYYKLTPAEEDVLIAYRSADSGTQAAIRKLLDLPLREESSVSVG